MKADRKSQMQAFDDRCLDDFNQGIDYDAELDLAFTSAESTIPSYLRPPGPEAGAILEEYGLDRDDYLVLVTRNRGEPEISYVFTGGGAPCEEELTLLQVGLVDIGPEQAEMMLRIFGRLLASAEVKETSILWDLLIEASPRFAEANPLW
jgi:hypothetical protein